MQLLPSTVAAVTGEQLHFTLAGISPNESAACTWNTNNDVLVSTGPGEYVARDNGTATVTGICGDEESSASVTVSSEQSSGPIVITKGGTYSGKWTSNDPAVPVVTIKTDEPVVLQNSTIAGTGNLIMAYGGSRGIHLQVNNVIGQALVASTAGKAKGMFLYIEGLASLDVTQCSILGASSGVIVAPSTPSHLSIKQNKGINLDDRSTNGSGGMSSSRATLGHFILLNQVIAPNGAEIGWNQIVNTPGQSSVEDIINIDGSQGGSTGKPIAIHDNYLQGAASIVGAAYSGGGITIDGDSSDTHPSAYISVINNEIVSTQNGGLFIANGHDVVMTGNRVISSGVTANGTWLASVGNGGYGLELQNFYSSKYFYNNSVSGNYSAMVRRDSTGNAIRSDLWIPDVSVALNNSANNNVFYAPTGNAAAVTYALEQAEEEVWQTKLEAASINVGSH